MRTMRYIAAIGALALTAPATAADKMIMSVFPTTVAALVERRPAKGYFTEQGIELESKWMNRGRDTIQALGADQVDLGLGAITPILAARAKGLPIVIIGCTATDSPATSSPARRTLS